MRKGRSHRYEAIVILLAVTAFSFTAGHPFAFQALMGAALLGFFFGGLIPIPRPLLLVLALIGGLVLFGSQPSPPSTHGFFINTLALPVYQVGLFLAIMAVVFLYRKNTPGEGLFALCLALGVTAGAGVTYHVWPYVVFIVLQALFLGLYFRSDLPGLPKGFRSTIRVVLPFLLCLITASALAVCLGWTESKVNFLLSLSEPPLSGSSAFSSTTGLSSIRSMESGGRVVMRVASRASGTYLLGRVYVHYRNREWGSLSKTQEIGPAAVPLAEGIFPQGRGAVFSLREAVLPREGWRPTFVERVDLVSPDGGTLF
ncbi:MAG: hypothetical protein HYU64_18110, partial [Armatimonadetes bacterium]|nr:hypothetical protein [Armatimonadota bacterium]